MKSRFTKLAAAAATAAATVLTLALPAQAAVVTFTGGTVVGGGDYYDQAGFRLDVIGDTGFFSDYYGAGNEVIHAHWATGLYGSATAIEITKIGGGTFDLNYFILTSNTDTGGSTASGSEMAWVEGFVGGVSTGAPVLLPPEDWGFPATQIFLGSNFDAVDTVRFFVTNAVDCFGMDEFYIDEEPPGRTPEPASLALAGLALASLAAASRKRK